MVALAILAMTLVVLLEIVTNNVRATNHSKMTTTATFLARAKMIDVEDLVLDNGFSDADESETGTFKDQGSPGFRWEYAIERIELPTDMAQKTQAQAQETSQSAKDPFAMMSGFLGGMMSSFIEPIRIGLQESVRKVTVRVLWDENGRPNQNMEVVQYLTDPPSWISRSRAARRALSRARPVYRAAHPPRPPRRGSGDEEEEKSASGFTLIEVMLALAILTFITAIMWGSFSQTATDKRAIEAAQDRLHTVRVALARMSREIEMAFLSDAENTALVEKRTFFVGSSHGDVDELSFSTFAHQRLRGGLAEADTAVVRYYGERDPDDRRILNLMHRETRRLQAEEPKTIAGEAYVLCPDVAREIRLLRSQEEGMAERVEHATLLGRSTSPPTCASP
jgi:prepilin-type N-terminal cleavage/methylation domain-containing protein